MGWACGGQLLKAMSQAGLLRKSNWCNNSTLYGEAELHFIHFLTSVSFEQVPTVHLYTPKPYENRVYRGMKKSARISVQMYRFWPLDLLCSDY